MSISEIMTRELENEAASTRKLLAAYPADKFSYKPHPKSMTGGQLAGHLVEIFGWGKTTMEKDVFEMDPSQYKPFLPQTTEELLGKFDEDLAGCLASLRGVPDEKMHAQWTMKVGGKEVMAMPRVAVMNAFIIKHLVHHRAQLGVYLRLNDVPVPQVYGPTADFPQMMR